MTTEATDVTPSGSVEEQRDGMLRISRGFYYLAAFCIPLTAVRGGFGLPLSDVLLLACVYPCIVNVSRRQVTIPKLWLATTVIVVVAMTALLGTLKASAPENTSVFVRLVFIFALWPAITYACLVDRRHYQRAGAAFALGASLSGTIGALQALGTDLRPLFLATTTDATNQIARYIGLNGQANGQGGTLAVAFTLCVASAFAGWHRRAATLAAALCAVGIIVSGSLTGTIAAALGMTLLLVRQRRVRLVFATALFVGVGYSALRFLQVVAPDVQTPFARYSSASGQTGISTLQLRLDTINFAWERIQIDPWTGAGFSPIQTSTIAPMLQVHNMEILAWRQGGILLMVAISVAVIGVLIAAWRIQAHPLLEALAVASMVALFFAQTGPALFDRYVWFAPVLLTVLLRHEREMAAGRSDR